MAGVFHAGLTAAVTRRAVTFICRKLACFERTAASTLIRRMCCTLRLPCPSHDVGTGMYRCPHARQTVHPSTRQQGACGKQAGCAFVYRAESTFKPLSAALSPLPTTSSCFKVTPAAARTVTLQGSSHLGVLHVLQVRVVAYRDSSALRKAQEMRAKHILQTYNQAHRVFPKVRRQG
jgi:hypothetical protein